MTRALALHLAPTCQALHPVAAALLLLCCPVMCHPLSSLPLCSLVLPDHVPQVFVTLPCLTHFLANAFAPELRASIIEGRSIEEEQTISGNAQP